MEWLDDFEHSSITDGNREAFNTHMAKFSTQADAVVDGFGLAKLKGKPFKLPESMDKLPDDTSRADFAVGVKKLLGIKHAVSIEDLADLNLKDGMADGGKFDENLATSFKQFIVDEKLNISEAGKYAKFLNIAVGKAGDTLEAGKEAEKIAAAEKTNEALIKHFGSKEKVAEQSELLKRAVMNNVGLTKDEAEEFGDTMADTLLTKNPVMARTMLKILAPLAASSSNDGGGGGTPPGIPIDPDEGSPTYVALGFSSPEQAQVWASKQVQIK